MLNEILVDFQRLGIFSVTLKGTSKNKINKTERERERERDRERSRSENPLTLKILPPNKGKNIETKNRGDKEIKQ